jgi:hypothetical protein
MLMPVLAYCSKDCDGCLRVLNWMGFLSRENGHSLKRESILLLASNAVEARRRHREIVQAATEVFGHVYVHVNSSLDEKGWPSSPNAMFYSALVHVEEHFKADMLWLEPDAIPLCEDWLDVINAEWATAREHGKSFCGNFVPHWVDHMTGIAVYGANWRQVAPSLATIVVNGQGIHEAFDTHAAKEIVPHAYFTKRIQHIFYSPTITDLEILSPEAVIFHQDKSAKLIALLDEELYDGRAGSDPRFSYMGIEPTVSEMKFFHSENSNRVIKSQGLAFQFESYEIFGGAWRGTFATQDEGQIAALLALTSNARSGVTEIDKETFEAKSKKKVVALPTSDHSKPAYQARINNSPAEVVVVDNPSPSPDMTATGPVPEKIEDVLRIAKIEPATESKPGRAKKMRPGKENK